ncbi:MAG: TIGR04283 family arsenosugar biosynthesis glycosyltransferase [Elainellaceae cyanobacterium]
MALLKISIIIPTLNEASTIQQVLQTVEAGKKHEQAIEVIIVDAGSQDQTVALAQQFGAKVLVSLPGRGQQMNMGAQAATGDILLFLHADTRLPAGFATLVRQALEQPDVVAGAFDLQIDGQEWGLRWVEWGVKWRSRLLQYPYGDQALFLMAKTFWQVGGFPKLPIMEDYEFVRQLKRSGRIAIVPTPVTTSKRRWHRLGIVRTTLINQWIVIAYRLGVAPEQLASWYRGIKK